MSKSPPDMARTASAIRGPTGPMTARLVPNAECIFQRTFLPASASIAERLNAIAAVAATAVAFFRKSNFIGFSR